MCWNSSVSINTYIFGLFACLFSYSNGVINIYDFLLYQSFMIMQLIEYLVWTKTFSNRLLSQIAFITVLSQPLFNILRLKSKPEWIPYLLISYISFLIISIIFISSYQNINFTMTASKNGHLSWNWLDIQYFPIYLFIWYAFYSITFIIEKWYLAYFNLTLLLIISLVLFSNTHTWGSMWCWFANATSIYLIANVFYKEFCTI